MLTYFILFYLAILTVFVIRAVLTVWVSLKNLEKEFELLVKDYNESKKQQTDFEDWTISQVQSEAYRHVELKKEIRELRIKLHVRA